MSVVLRCILIGTAEKYSETIDMVAKIVFHRFMQCNRTGGCKFYDGICAVKEHRGKQPHTSTIRMLFYVQNHEFLLQMFGV